MVGRETVSFIFHNAFKSPQAHLSEAELNLLVDCEMALRQKRDAELHIASCGACRMARERLEEARRQVTAYLDAHRIPELPATNARRERLEAGLDALLHDTRANGRGKFRASRRGLVAAFRQTGMGSRVSLIAGGAVAACVVSLCVFPGLTLRSQPTKADLTEEVVLGRAISSERSLTTRTGVVTQRVRITRSARGSVPVLERAIYSDASGLRRRRSEKLALDEGTLAARLEAVGVLWDAPLSATTYRTWHDRQRLPQDKVEVLSGHLLLLSTKVADGVVASESLTVRDSDFHPIMRTIDFRDAESAEQIQIAELDYSVAPWSVANAALFEPVCALVGPGAARPFTQTLIVPTDAQLDEAELDARLVLNQMHADSGEQMSLSRSERQVELKGLVETDRRKVELVESLHSVANLKVSIVSMEELLRASAGGADMTSSEQTSVSASPSPLETYFAGQGRDASSLRHLSQQLLSHAITVSQESRALADLDRRFPSRAGMTLIANATLSMLVHSHRERLATAREEEEALLRQIPEASAIAILDQPAGNKVQDLESAAERNLRFCRELTLGSSLPSRTAISILPDIAVALDEIDRGMHQPITDSQPSTLQVGRR